MLINKVEICGVNRLLKQFEDTRKMMKTVAGGMPKMMRHGKRR